MNFLKIINLILVSFTIFINLKLLYNKDNSKELYFIFDIKNSLFYILDLLSVKITKH